MTDDVKLHFGWTIYWKMVGSEWGPVDLAPKFGLKSVRQVDRILASAKPPRDMKRKIKIARAFNMEWDALEREWEAVKVKRPPREDVVTKRTATAFSKFTEASPNSQRDILDLVQREQVKKLLADVADYLREDVPTKGRRTA